MAEMVLLDWTRMGKTYCLAGVVTHKGQMRVVRPILATHREHTDRKIGWFARLLEGRSRWEIFDIVGGLPAGEEPPHLEDWWAHGLRSRGRLAPTEQRRQILQATQAQPGELLFGAPLTALRSVAFLQPSTGQRSLVTVQVPGSSITFAGSHRDGAADVEFRVQLTLPEVGPRHLPVKDHHLLKKAEAAGPNIDARLAALADAVRAMGERVAVRLGLSRAFGSTTNAQSQCWLMADGFFSWSNPEP
jgi:hypothetical protein